MSYWIQETYLNNTEGYCFGESDIYDTDEENLGKLYRELSREYGRCTGKVHTDKDGPIGWVFIKKVQYEDSKDTYLREVWVTVHTAPNTVTTICNYAKI